MSCCERSSGGRLLVPKFSAADSAAAAAASAVACAVGALSAYRWGTAPLPAASSLAAAVYLFHRRPQFEGCDLPFLDLPLDGIEEVAWRGLEEAPMWPWEPPPPSASPLLPRAFRFKVCWRKRETGLHARSGRGAPAAAGCCAHAGLGQGMPSPSPLASWQWLESDMSCPHFVLISKCNASHSCCLRRCRHPSVPMGCQSPWLPCCFRWRRCWAWACGDGDSDLGRMQ